MIAQNMTEASPMLGKRTQTLPLIGHERLPRSRSPAGLIFAKDPLGDLHIYFTG